MVCFTLIMMVCRVLFYTDIGDLSKFVSYLCWWLFVCFYLYYWCVVVCFMLVLVVCRVLLSNRTTSSWNLWSSVLRKITLQWTSHCFILYPRVNITLSNTVYRISVMFFEDAAPPYKIDSLNRKMDTVNCYTPLYYSITILLYHFWKENTSIWI